MLNFYSKHFQERKSDLLELPAPDTGVGPPPPDGDPGDSAPERRSSPSPTSSSRSSSMSSKTAKSSKGSKVNPRGAPSKPLNNTNVAKEVVEETNDTSLMEEQLKKNLKEVTA